MLTWDRGAAIESSSTRSPQAKLSPFLRHNDKDSKQHAISESTRQYGCSACGREHIASATPLARFAVAQVRQGRRVGGRLNSVDVSSEYCRAKKGVLLLSLDSPDQASGSCRELLVEDQRSTPADVAAARIDIDQWLTTLPGRRRRLAELLATGETTSDAAVAFSISRGRVSQLRRELRRAWLTFQGDAVPAMTVINTARAQLPSR